MPALKHAGVHRPFAAIAVAGALVALATPSPASGQLAQPQALPERPSPELIERAQKAGRIDRDRANLYRVYALEGDPRLPDAYESDAPYDGTFELLEARRALARMQPGAERQAVAAALRVPPDPNMTTCDSLSVAPLPDSAETAHFYIQYNEAALEPSLDIEDYRQSLETAWLTEVDSFRWAAPPDTALGARSRAASTTCESTPSDPGCTAS